MSRMSARLRGHKRASLPLSANTTEDVSPPKQKALLFSPSLLDLPSPTVHHIFQYLSLHHLSRLTFVSHSFTNAVLTFCRSSLSLPILFPSMFTLTAKSSSTKYKLEDCKYVLELDPATARTNFTLLGELAKRLTCLLPTEERVTVSSELVSRFSWCQGGSGPLMTVIGVFFHTLVRGWADDECFLAANVILRLFDNVLGMTELLSSHYTLGSRPDQEILARNFLGSVFYHEVIGRNMQEVRHQQRIWLRALVLAVSSERRSSVIGRVLLLVSSPVRKDEVGQYSIQWLDHEEAIPANMAVASGRYQFLVSLLQCIHHMVSTPVQLPKVLACIFQIPGPWLPENVGSVLLLLGHNITRNYLYSTATLRPHTCTNCFKPLTIALIGLAVMTARFRRTFTVFFHQLDEVMELVSGNLTQRRSMLTALWEGLTGEVRDLRLAQGEDWAQEGAMHLVAVIRAIGQRMMEKAYMVPRSQMVREE